MRTVRESGLFGMYCFLLLRRAVVEISRTLGYYCFINLNFVQLCKIGLPSIWVQQKRTGIIVFLYTYSCCPATSLAIAEKKKGGEDFDTEFSAWICLLSWSEARQMEVIRGVLYLESCAVP